MPITYKEEMIKNKYVEIPEEPRYKKKKKKKPHIKVNHKHRYASALFNCGHFVYYFGIKEPKYYIIEYCTVCGRIKDVIAGGNISNSNLPVFKVKFEDLFAKRINLEDTSLI